MCISEGHIFLGFAGLKSLIFHIHNRAYKFQVYNSVTSIYILNDSPHSVFLPLSPILGVLLPSPLVDRVARIVDVKPE